LQRNSFFLALLQTSTLLPFPKAESGGKEKK